jgi:phosphomevalonate kinase
LYVAIKFFSTQRSLLWPYFQWSSLVGVSLPSNTISEVLLSLQLTFCGQGSHSNSVRGLLRQVGDAAGVGIEPIEQTNLLDRVCQLPGVLFAGVPGAGGHDAIFCILLRSDDIGSVGQQMTLIDGGGRVKPLQVSRADEGVRCDFEQ